MRTFILFTILVAYFSSGFCQETNEKHSGLYFRTGVSMLVYNANHTAGSPYHNSTNDGIGSIYGPMIGIGPLLEFGYHINKDWSVGIHCRSAINITSDDLFGVPIPIFRLFSSAGIDVERKFSNRWSVLVTTNMNKYRRSQAFFSIGVGPKVVLGKKKDVALKLTAEIFSFTEEAYNHSIRGSVLDLGMSFNIK